MAGPLEGGWEELFLEREITFTLSHIHFLSVSQSSANHPLPEVVATELRVEAVTVELLLSPRPKLLPLLRLEETLATGGGAETELDVVEKVLEEEWRLASLSTLVCLKKGER